MNNSGHRVANGELACFPDGIKHRLMRAIRVPALALARRRERAADAARDKAARQRDRGDRQHIRRKPHGDPGCRQPHRRARLAVEALRIGLLDSAAASAERELPTERAAAVR